MTENEPKAFKPDNKEQEKNVQAILQSLNSEDFHNSFALNAVHKNKENDTLDTNTGAYVDIDTGIPTQWESPELSNEESHRQINNSESKINFTIQYDPEDSTETPIISGISYNQGLKQKPALLTKTANGILKQAILHFTRTNLEKRYGTQYRAISE